MVGSFNEEAQAIWDFVRCQRADGGHFDFGRCQRDDGTVYASPTDNCRKGTKIDADAGAGEKKPASAKKMRLTAKIKAMSATDLKKVAADPRLSDRQKEQLNRLIKAKKGEEKENAGAEVKGEGGRVGRTAEQEMKREESTPQKIDPKYEKTPGSTKSIARAKAEGLLNPNLKEIYKEQGFNAKPELVGTAEDLDKRKDLLTNMDGTNVVLYRGVTTQEFSDQFKGLGPNGDEHFAGRGMYGNGSYAVAPPFDNPGRKANAGKDTAARYSGERENLSSKVTAFGLRSDANVVTFPGANYNERSRSYDEWHDRTLKEAEKKTGYKFKDVGEAAASLGIHAYQVPDSPNRDFYVILNRGAVVAATDSQLPDDQGL